MTRWSGTPTARDEATSRKWMVVDMNHHRRNVFPELPLQEQVLDTHLGNQSYLHCGDPLPLTSPSKD